MLGGDADCTTAIAARKADKSAAAQALQRSRDIETVGIAFGLEHPTDIPVLVESLLQRLGKAEHLNTPFIFFASDACGHGTGQLLVVNAAESAQ